MVGSLWRKRLVKIWVFSLEWEREVVMDSGAHGNGDLREAGWWSEDKEES